MFILLFWLETIFHPSIFEINPEIKGKNKNPKAINKYETKSAK